MKLKSKEHWHELIYGLVYPGFIGSMIYELIPQNSSDMNNYINLRTGLKFLIVFFYSLDFLHLYGDMEKEIKLNDRKLDYFLCDIATALLFFFSFIMVKNSYAEVSIWLIAFVPAFVCFYKRKNYHDRLYLIPYSIVSILTAGIFCMSKYLWKTVVNAEAFLALFILISFLIYCFYVFSYYEKKSKGNYKRTIAQLNVSVLIIFI